MPFENKSFAERFPKLQKPEEPGFIESAARNFFSSLGNVIGTGLGAYGEIGVANDKNRDDLLTQITGKEIPFFENLNYNNKLFSDLGYKLADASQNLVGNANLRPEYENQGVIDRLTNPQYWTDPRGATADAFSGAGSSLPFMGLGLGARALGLALPTRAIGSKALSLLSENGGALGRAASSAISRGMGTKVGQALGESADIGLNYALTTGPLDAMTNAGELYQPLRDAGFNDKEIAQLMRRSMAEELPVDIAEAMITGNTILGKGFGLLGKSRAGRIAGALANVPIEMGGEYVQEGYQTRGTQKYLGQDYTESPFSNLFSGKEMFETQPERSAATSGALGAILQSAYGVGKSAFSSNEEETPQETPREAPPREETPTKPYMGENGKGEGRYWIKQNDDVSYKGAKPETMNAMDALGKWFYDQTGKPLTITAVTNGSSHAEGERGHYAGVKFDANDNGGGALGKLTTDDFQVTELGRQLEKYGQSLGLGMNWEGVGTDNIHLDVSVLGDQWIGEHAGKNFGGFGKTNITSGNVGNDPDFSERQNKFWRLAQYAAARAKKKYGMNLDPAWIYRQWAHESGANFDANKALDSVHNYGGLTQKEKNDLPQPDGAGYYRKFQNDNEYADAFIDDFIGKRPELKAARTMEDYVKILHDTGYFTDSPENYFAGMENIRVPKTRVPESRKSQPKVSKNEKEINSILEGMLNQKIEPVFDPTKKDDVLTREIIFDFVNYKKNETEGVEAANFEDFAEEYKLFKDGKFVNSKNNRGLILNEYGDELKEFGQRDLEERLNQLREQQTPKALANDIESYRGGLKKLQEEKIKNNDVQGYQEIQSLIQSGDEKQMRSKLKEAGYEFEPMTITDPTEVEVGTAWQNFNRDDEVAYGQELAGQLAANNISVDEGLSQRLAQGKGGAINEALTLLNEDSRNKERQHLELNLKGLEWQAVSTFNALQAALKSNDAEQIQSTRQEMDLLKQQINATNDRLKQLQGRKAQVQPPSILDDYSLATQPLSAEGKQNYGRQAEQGEAIIRLANNPEIQKIANQEINLPEDLQKKLRAGNREAIKQAQQILDSAGIKLDSIQAPKERKTLEGLTGNNATVATDNGRELVTRYRIVEAKDITASHGINKSGDVVSENEEYPQELQPRDRADRVMMRLQTTKMANELKPADLQESRNINQGAAVVRGDGVVLNGNGRTMAISHAYDIGKGDGYKNSLIQNAEKFGMSADEVSKMERPILVREVVHDLSDEEIADITQSTAGGMRLGASEQAKIDAGKITPEILSSYVPNEDGDITKPENREFVNDVLNAILDINDLNAYKDKDGKPNADGLTRVKRAIFAAAYEDDGVLARMAEAHSTNVDNLIKALTNAAPAIVSVKKAIKSGTLQPYTIAEDISRAVKRISALRDEGKTVNIYLQEQTLDFENSDSPETQEIVQFMDRNKLAPNKITKFLNNISSEIESQGNPNQTSMFEEMTKPLSLMEIIKKSAESVEGKLPQEQQSAPKAETPVADKQEQPQPTSSEGESQVSTEPIKFGDKLASDIFKGRMRSDKTREAFDETMNETVEVNGKEMTRLAVAESIAKGELPDNVIKNKKGERNYIEFLRKGLAKQGQQAETPVSEEQPQPQPAPAQEQQTPPQAESPQQVQPQSEQPQAQPTPAQKQEQSQPQPQPQPTPTPEQPTPIQPQPQQVTPSDENVAPEPKTNNVQPNDNEVAKPNEGTQPQSPPQVETPKEKAPANDAGNFFEGNETPFTDEQLRELERISAQENEGNETPSQNNTDEPQGAEEVSVQDNQADDALQGQFQKYTDSLKGTRYGESYKETLSEVVERDGVKATRRKHVERIFKENPQVDESVFDKNSERGYLKYLQENAVKTDADEENQSEPVWRVKEKNDGTPSPEKASSQDEQKSPKLNAQGDSANSSDENVQKIEQADNSEQKKQQLFSTPKEADEDVLEAFKNFGKKSTKQGTSAKKPTTPKKVKATNGETKNKTVIPKRKYVNLVADSDEAIAGYMAELYRGTQKSSAMPMFNPKIWVPALKIGIAYIQRGLNNFLNWADQMTKTMGPEYQTWQPAIWETLRTMPEMDEFNDAQIAAIANKVGSLYENGTTSLQEINKDFERLLGEDVVKQIEPMIAATYNGVKKFFEDNAKQESNDDRINAEKSVAQNDQNGKGKVETIDGKLHIDGKPAAELFKARKLNEKSRPAFDKQMAKRVKVDGKEMTRLELAEGIAKGEIPKDKVKLTEGERNYIDFLHQNGVVAKQSEEADDIDTTPEGKDDDWYKADAQDALEKWRAGNGKHITDEIKRKNGLALDVMKWAELGIMDWRKANELLKGVLNGRETELSSAARVDAYKKIAAKIKSGGYETKEIMIPSDVSAQIVNTERNGDEYETTVKISNLKNDKQIKLLKSLYRNLRKNEKAYEYEIDFTSEHEDLSKNSAQTLVEIADILSGGKQSKAETSSKQGEKVSGKKSTSKKAAKKITVDDAKKAVDETYKKFLDGKISADKATDLLDKIEDTFGSMNEDELSQAKEYVSEFKEQILEAAQKTNDENEIATPKEIKPSEKSESDVKTKAVAKNEPKDYNNDTESTELQAEATNDAGSIDSQKQAGHKENTDKVSERKTEKDETALVTQEQSSKDAVEKKADELLNKFFDKHQNVSRTVNMANPINLELSETDDSFAVTIYDPERKVSTRLIKMIDEIPKAEYRGTTNYETSVVDEYTKFKDITFNFSSEFDRQVFLKMAEKCLIAPQETSGVKKESESDKAIDAKINQITLDDVKAKLSKMYQQFLKGDISEEQATNTLERMANLIFQSSTMNPEDKLEANDYINDYYFEISTKAQDSFLTSLSMEIDGEPAVEKFRRQTAMSEIERKAFFNNMIKLVEFNGEKVTKVEALERMAKGEKPDTPFQTNKGDKKYIDCVKKHLLAEGVKSNVTDDSPDGVVKRVGTGENQDAVGRDDEDGESGGRSVSEGVSPSGAKVRTQRGVRVQAGGAADSGEGRDSGVQAEEPANNAGSTGSDELSGSDRDDTAGSELDDGREADTLGVTENGRVDEGENKAKSKSATKVPYKAGDLKSIKQDLPMLKPEQQEDVAFMEERLLTNGATGVLLANGTGTGKTFSGLGIIKRLFDSGKKNILIVTPSPDINTQWIETAAKSFGLDIHKLDDTKDSGAEGQICITTYANFYQNRELATRNWDAVIADESHNLLSNADGNTTSFLHMFRNLTLNPRKWYENWRLKNRTKAIRKLEDEIAALEKKLRKVKAKAKKTGIVSDYEIKKIESQIDDKSREIESAYFAMEDQWQIMKAELESMNPAERPKAIFLSATPFSYDKCVDYAEGYLFDYGEGGYEDFMVKNFGYRILKGELVKPAAKVDNRVMEVTFHDKLVDSGAMRGRQIEVDADYDRGFILVDSGIGKTIDDGFSWLREHRDEFDVLLEAFERQLEERHRLYLLESIKARASVPLIKEYLASGKKVVVFHQAMMERENVIPFKLSKDFVKKLASQGFDINKLSAQYQLFKKKRSDLVGLNLNDLPSPMETFRDAFGEDALYVDGQHKERDKAIKLFNDDNSGKNLIICQQDAAGAGLSLHDTTGKYPRVLINIAFPKRPVYAMQIEGRIYRTGNKSNATFRYLATGTNLERKLFAEIIGRRAATVENLALGDAARGLSESFADLFMETLSDDWHRRAPGHAEEGTGGKEMDSPDKLKSSDWQRAVSYYFDRLKKAASSNSEDIKNHIATPEPLGLKMVEWLGLREGERALEPSAGRGAISRWFSPNTQNTIIEPNSNLVTLAQMVTQDAKVVNGDFENLDLVNKFDGIAMNPPFGQGGKTAIEHLSKAYKHLADGGRIIAIVPENTSFYMQFEKWLKGDDAKNAILTATIHLPNVTFESAGKKLATKLLVIDKHNNEQNHAKAASKAGFELDLRNVKDIDELFGKLENLELPERLEPQENPFAEIEKKLSKITTTKDKDGNVKYFINGKQVTQKAAKDLDLKQTEAKGDVLFNKFREENDIEEPPEEVDVEYKVYVEIPTSLGGSGITSGRFNTREEAIDCVRYIAKNYDRYVYIDENAEDEDENFSIGALKNGRHIFAINPQTGKEKFIKSDKEPSLKLPKVEEPQEKSDTLISQDDIEVGIYTHTQTGEKIPSVKLKIGVSTEEYQQISQLAKKHGGYYNKFAKKFLFKTVAGRDDFVKAATGNVKTETSDNVKAMNNDDAKTKATPASKSKISSVEECKNFDQLEEFIKTEYDAEFEGQIKKLNFELVKAVISGFLDTLGKFPDVLKYFKGVTLQCVPIDAMATYNVPLSGTVGVLGLNSIGYSQSTKEFIKNRKAEKGLANINKVSNKKVMREAGAHEAGHALHKISDYKSGIICNFRVTAEDFVNWAYESIAHGNKTLEEYRKEISEYATTTYAETIAEAVADYEMNGEKSTELSKAIWEKLNLALTTDEWFNYEILSKNPEEIIESLHDSLSADSTLKWINARIKAGDDARLITVAAQLLPYSDELRKELKDVTTLAKLQKIIQDYLPIEDIKFDENEWTDEKINETYSKFRGLTSRETAYAIVQLGGEVRNGKVVYPDERTRRNISKYLQTITEPTTKFSKRGNVDLKDVEFVSQEEMNKEQQAIAEFGKQMGVPVIYFKGDAEMHGAYSNGITYLNVNSKMPLGQVFWHESLHWMSENNSELFAELAEAAGLTEEQLQNYVDETARKDLTGKDKKTANRAKVTEEMLADAMQKVLSKVQDKNLLQRIMLWIRNALGKFKEHFHKPTGELTTAQYNRIADAFGKMSTKLTDADGNKIFRYNRRTKALELANGESLDRFADVTVGNDDTNDKVLENSIESATVDEWTDERINQAATNPNIANAIDQLGGKIVAGKVQFPNAQIRQSVINNLKNLNDPDFKFSIAWHGSPHQFDSFSLDAIGSGEGAQVHGWGLYFAANREVSEGYKKRLTRLNRSPMIIQNIEVSINGKKFTKSNSRESWKNESGVEVIPYSKWSKNNMVSPAESSILQALGVLYSHYDIHEAIDTLKRWIKMTQRSVQKSKDVESKEYYLEIIDKYKGALKMLQNGDVKITKDTRNGTLFKVDIPDSNVMLDEQKKFSEQPFNVQFALKKIAYHRKISLSDEMTGRQIYESISDTFDKDIHKGSIEASKLLNANGVKGITYVGGLDGRCYVVFDDKAIKILEKLSRFGNADTSVADIVSSEKLNSRQQAIAEFGKQMGVPVIYFKGDPNLNGAYNNGITYINVDAKMSHSWTFWHEAFHWMANNNRELYEELMEYVAGTEGFSAKQLDEYREKFGRPDLSDEATIEEMLADTMIEVSRRVPFLQEMGKKDKSLVEKIISWLRDAMDRFRDFMNKPNAGLTREQSNRMRDAFEKMAGSIVDADGRGIFKIYSTAHRITLVNGKTLPSIKFSAMDTSVVQFSGKGELRKMFDAAKRLSTDELNSQEKKWVEFGESLGLKVQWLEGHANLKGAIQGNTIYLNRRGGENISKIFYHEQFHLISALNPDLHSELLEYFKGTAAFSKEQLDAYRQKNNRLDLSDAEVIEEILCDNFNQVQNRVQILQEMSQENPNLLKRFVAYVKNLMEKFVSAFHNPEGGMTTAQRDAFIKGFNEMVGKLKDANGNKLYTTYKDGKGLRLADGAEIYGVELRFKGNENDIRYSASDSSQNSGGLKQRISNLKDALVSPNPLNERTRQRINRLLGELSGYKISTGHLKDGVDIIIDDFQKVIRTRNTYDWEKEGSKLLPAIGEKVSEHLGLSKSAALSNYIADWLLTGAANNNSAEAQAFQNAMRNNPDYAERLIDVQLAITSFMNKSAEERTREKISQEKERHSVRTKAGKFFREQYDDFIEELEPVNRLVKEIEAKAGMKLSSSANPMTAFRVYRGMAGRARVMIEGKGEESINALKNLMPQMNFDGFKTLKMILEGIGAANDKAKREDFSNYLLACSTKELHLKNHANEKNQQIMQSRIDKTEDELSKSSDAEEKKKLQKKIKRYRESLKELKAEIYNTPMTEADCDEIIKNRSSEFGAAQKEVIRYSRMLLDMMYVNGVVGDDRYKELVKTWQDHVPMFRVFDENEDIKFGDSLKHMLGSDKDVIDPLQSIIKNTYTFVKRAEMNRAKGLLAGLVRVGGVGELISEVEVQNPNDGTIITYYENGEKKYLQTSKEIVKAVKNLSPAQMTWFGRFLRIGTTILRNMVTVWNPNFAVRNLFRDQQDAYLYSGKYSTGISDDIKDFLQGFKYLFSGIGHALRQDEVFNEWLVSGAAQASFWSLDRDYTQVSLDNMTKNKWERYGSIQGLFRLLQRFGEFSELGTRIGHYQRVKDKLAKQHGGVNTHDDLITAALESRDLIDFARGGKSSRQYNTLTAFANARMQGWDKFLRTFNPMQAKTAEGRKQLGHAVMRLMLSSVLPTVLLFMMNHDEDWYKKDLPDWERRSHWIIGENLRIPKGMDFGIRMFSNLTEEFLNWAYNNKPLEFNKMIAPLVDEAPDIIPTAMQPIFENWANYDIFRRRNIVPMHQQGLPDKYQFSDQTSELAKALGEMFDYSPEKIDHFIYGYTGNLGKYFLKYADVLSGKKSADFTASNLPLVGGLLRMPYQSPRILNEFYDKLNEQSKLHNEYKLTNKRPAGFNENLYKRMTRIQRELQKVTKMERDNFSNTKISSSERSRRFLILQKKRMALVEPVLR